MLSLPILDRSGAEVGRYEIDPAELAPRINRQLLHDAVVMYRSNVRQGSAKTKARSEVAGTTKKMYRQKGTGRARAGSRRTNIRRGGGHAKARRPRDWSYRLPRKALRAATRMALAARLADGEVTLIDQFNLSAAKTKEMAGILKAVGCGGKRLLVTTAGYDATVYRTARNIEKVSVSPVAELNALSLLAPQRLLFTKAALDAFRQRTSGARAGGAG
jgi:large subunit ribosomal protein L4